MSRKRYSFQTLIGNWEEENHKNTERKHRLTKKLENEDLLLQRFKDMTLSINKQVFLSMHPNGIANFGDTIQIYHSPNYCINIKLTAEMVVGKKMSTQHFSVGMSQLENFPTKKSSFTITPISSQSLNQPLRYAQKFLLSVNVTDKPMYLSCRSCTSGGITNCYSSDVFLTEFPTQNSQWMIQHVDPEWRMEYEDYQVAINRDLIINSSCTNQSLAVNMSYDGFVNETVEMIPYNNNRRTSVSQKEIWRLISSHF